MSEWVARAYNVAASVQSTAALQSTDATVEAVTDPIEESINRYMNSGAFGTLHSRSATLWEYTAQKLWSPEADDLATEIGHVCREAMQEFMDELVQRIRPPDASSDKTKIIQRLKALIDVRAESTSVSEFAEALLAYWGTVSDLAQRQEHGAQREGDQLTWEDSRRLVFQTANVMFELSRLYDSLH